VTPPEAPLSLGIDAVEVERFRAVLARRPSLKARLFTSDEQVNLDGTPRSIESLAARFAAKEATMKVLGVGVGAVAFHSIALTTSASGAPELRLSGKAKALAEAKGLGIFTCSLTHTNSVAMAVVGSVHN
jgi:holo-[acyl-carrier protein] synthase